MRIVNEEGKDAGVGEVGEIVGRGPARDAGTTNDPTSPNKQLLMAGCTRAIWVMSMRTVSFSRGRMKDLIISGRMQCLSQGH